YEQFCGMPAHDHSNYQSSGTELPVPEISPVRLKERLDAGEDILIVDVRDPHEWEIVSLPVENVLKIPKGDIQAAKNALLAGRKLRDESILAQIPDDREIAFLCRSGKRSADSIRFLWEAGYKNRLVNITGGILAWSDLLDPDMPQY
ncbi:MAG: hypothetical protein K8I60_06075, partial [Anaerolineae bacterium]|nr:hypothetical protein [Anaerolineae bacterium]